LEYRSSAKLVYPPLTSSLIYKRDGHEPYTPNKALAGREHERQISGIQALSPLRLVLPRGSRSGEGSESDDPTPTCSARTRKATPLSPRWLCDRSSSAADGHSAVTCFILDAVSVCCTFTVRSVCRPAHPPHRIEFQGPVDLIYNGKINPCLTQEYYTDSGFEFNTSVKHGEGSPGLAERRLRRAV
jgi:hypothetical protein